MVIESGSTPSSASLSPSDIAGGDFREPVHLVEIVGARPENEFINAHIALTLDRLFHRRARSRQRTEAPRRKIGIVSVVRVDIAARVLGGVLAERLITPSDPTRLSLSPRLLPCLFDLAPHLEQAFRLSAARRHVTIAPLCDALHDRGHITRS